MKIRATALVAVALIALTAAADSKLQYPLTKKVDQKDTYAGNVVVADPYRWLETDVRESDDVRQWVDAENRVTFDYLNSLPYRDKIKNKLSATINYEKYTVPVKRGGHYYFRKNNGLQNQSVLYVMKSLDDTPRVLIDPNTWSKDGTIALTSIHPSDDGRYLLYGVAEAGSDWLVWHLMEVDSGTVLPDEIHWVKFGGASWTKDSKGLFYSRFPEVKSGAAFQSLNTNSTVYYHRIGTPQSADPVVWKRADHPDWNFRPDVTDDGRYLVIETSVGTDARNQVLIRDLSEPYAMPIALVDNFEHEYSYIGNDGPTFYFKTDLDAPRKRVVAIDINAADRTWREVLPQSADLLDDASYLGGNFVAHYLHDAHSEVKVFSRDGKLVRTLDLPTLGTAAGFNGKADDPETFYSFESFTVPPSIYRYDVATGEKRLIFQSKVNFDPSQYEVKQVFYNSKDGTRVPMFIASRKGIRLDGNNPTLLYGYGGFDIATLPRFSASHLVWMQMGGIYASANMRGGSEYGEEWHKAGTKLHKQNVFDDFIAAAEYLINNKYTRPQKLAIQGASNGGLLIGAAMTQRPDLFGAALPAVGVMDMLRFQRFTAGRYWTDDYGSSDNADEFRALYAYSPYHNLKKGTSYPATLVTTADHDDRVVPGHSFKFAAQLQEDQAGPAPVLIRIETRAGHGAGKPITKQIEETADQYAFLVANLGMKPPSF